MDHDQCQKPINQLTLDKGGFTKLQIKYYAIVLLLFLLMSRSLSQDHLEPEDGIVTSSFSLHQYDFTVRRILLRELFPYPIFRMVCLPSFDPEWVVDVEKKFVDDDVKSNDVEEYSVIAVTTKKQIAHAMTMRNDPKPFMPESMKTEIRRTRIDSQTVARIYRVIQKSLAETRYSPHAQGGLDGVGYHFSSWGERIGFKFGKTWSPDEGSAVDKLVGLGELLYKYASEAKKDGSLDAKINAQLEMLGE